MRQGETFLSGGSKAPALADRPKSPRPVGRAGQRGWCGGLFVSRAAALKYALFENGNQAQLVVTILGTFDLDLSSNAAPGTEASRHKQASRHSNRADPALARDRPLS